MENNRKSAKVSLNSLRPELQVEDEDVEGKPFLKEPINYKGRR